MDGWYYLHTNGELIYKRDLDGTAADIRESTFARALWPMEPSDREGAWRILIEGLAAGANLKFWLTVGESIGGPMGTSGALPLATS